MHYITKAKYIKDYKIEVLFNDTKHGIIDLEDVIKNDHRKIFQELKDKNKFTKFKVAMDTIVWENGLDLSPEFIYSKLN